MTSIVDRQVGIFVLKFHGISFRKATHEVIVNIDCCELRLRSWFELPDNFKIIRLVKGTAECIR